jgi:putative nucleotidyltransferase with HDIG domain
VDPEPGSRRVWWGDGRRLRLHGPRFLLAGGLAVLTFALFPESPATNIPIYEVGAVAADNVIAPFSFEVPKTDDELRRERDDVARATAPIFRQVPQALDTSRALLAALERAVGAASAMRPQNLAAIEQAGRQYGVALTPREAAYLASPTRAGRTFAAARRVFDRWVSAGVAPTGAVDQLRGEVVLRRAGEEVRLPVDSILSFGQLVSRARVINPDPESETGTGVYLKVVTSLFRPTITLDVGETELRRAELRRLVPASKYAVRAGEKIVGAHEVVGREEHEKLRALELELGQQRGTKPRLRRALGAILFDLAILVLLFLTLYVFRPRLYMHWRSVVVVAGLVALVIGSAALVAGMRPIRSELIPVTLAAVVISALFDQRISIVVTMIVTILIGAQAPFRGTNALFVNLIGGAVAALTVRVVARRHQAYYWLLATGLAYLVATLAIGLMLDLGAATIATSTLHGALNALASILLALLILPLAESYTGIETDLTLLEWSDLNRPLMQRLSLEAPGTFAHTMVIANLADAACRAIGANALLARVGAYYHDIGKLVRPHYFVENQTKDRNPHDALDPDKSADIIKEHVVEGLRLAELYRLPKALRAFITEHHGTGPIAYFLGKAMEHGDAVDESAYAYPGPEPRSAETAVVMLADGVEAATRVLNEPTPARVREVIEHIVKQRLEQGQLRYAPLTLQQLEMMKAEFARVLAGMFHHRIDYPRQSGGVSSEFAAS